MRSKPPNRSTVPRRRLELDPHQMAAIE